MKYKRIFNTIFFAVAAYAIYLRLPVILSHFEFQDKVIPNFKMRTLDGGEFELYQQKKVALVFWATWCGPCEVELKRINKMIVDKKIRPENVLAVAGLEDQKLIEETMKKNGYQFPVGLDFDENASKIFKVQATPTIVFIDEKHTVEWMTSGLSPTLEYRLSSFLR